MSSRSACTARQRVRYERLLHIAGPFAEATCKKLGVSPPISNIQKEKQCSYERDDEGGIRTHAARNC